MPRTALGTALGSQLLFAMAMMTTCLSSATEARHWRHHGYYSYYGYDQGRAENREKETTFRNGSYLDPTYGFGAAIALMIHSCEEEFAELKKTPFEVIARTVQPNVSQRDALEQMRTATFAAAEMLSATCPKDIPAMPSQRLDTLSHALQAMTASLDSLRSSLVNFYTMLDDEQKAQVIVTIASSSQRTIDQTSRSRYIPTAGEISDEQVPLCGRWAKMLRSWPMQKIETELTLSDEQYAALHEVAAAMYRVAGNLSTCSNRDRLTPIGRLETRQMLIEVLQQGIDGVQPALTRFQNLLSEYQKALLGRIMDKSPIPGDRASSSKWPAPKNDSVPRRNTAGSTLSEAQDCRLAAAGRENRRLDYLCVTSDDYDSFSTIVLGA